MTGGAATTLAVRLGALRLARVVGRTGRLGVARRGCASALQSPGLDTSHWLVAFQVRGESTWRQGGWRARLRSGDFMICRVGMPYSLACSRDAELPVLWLDAATMARVTPDPGRFERRPMPGTDAACGLVTAAVGPLVRCIDRLSAPMQLRAESHVLGLVAGALASQVDMRPLTTDAKRAAVKAYVRDRIRDPRLSAARIAARFACTPRYLHSLFAVEPFTLGHYIRRVRVQECLRSIEHGAEQGATLAAVASRWGFYDASHLRRCVRAETGLDGTALRRRLARTVDAERTAEAERVGRPARAIG